MHKTIFERNNSLGYHHMVLNGKTKKTSENKTDVLVADVDECGATFSPCRWWAVCVNTLGSYSCHCRKGYGGKQCDVGKHSLYITGSHQYFLHHLQSGNSATQQSGLLAKL